SFFGPARVGGRRTPVGSGPRDVDGVDHGRGVGGAVRTLGGDGHRGVCEQQGRGVGGAQVRGCRVRPAPGAGLGTSHVLVDPTACAAAHVVALGPARVSGRWPSFRAGPARWVDVHHRGRRSPGSAGTVTAALLIRWALWAGRCRTAPPGRSLSSPPRDTGDSRTPGSGTLRGFPRDFPEDSEQEPLETS